MNNEAITQLEDVLDFVRLYYKDNLYLIDKIKAIKETLNQQNERNS
jgi:hypothetical protein